MNSVKFAWMNIVVNCFNLFFFLAGNRLLKSYIGLLNVLEIRGYLVHPTIYTRTCILCVAKIPFFYNIDNE